MWPCAGKTVRPRSAGAFRAGETQIVSSGDAFCVVLRRENSPTECFAQAKRKFWTAEMHFLWPCAGETQILTSGDASCPNEVDSRGVRTGWTKSPRRYSETQKENPGHGFAQAKRKFWPPESRFLWPCAGKTAAARKRHLDLRGFTLTVRTPQCDTLFGEKTWQSIMIPCHHYFVVSIQKYILKTHKDHHFRAKYSGYCSSGKASRSVSTQKWWPRALWDSHRTTSRWLRVARPTVWLIFGVLGHVLTSYIIL